MIHAVHRKIFRLTDKQLRRYEMIFKVGCGIRRVYTWTDLCLMALEELWKSMGSPEPEQPAASDKPPAKRQTDLFSFTRRSPTSPTSAPKRLPKRKRAKR